MIGQIQQTKQFMCLYPRLIRNKKYTSTKKNGGNIPEMKDARTGWVPVGCQKCMECKKQKARSWSVRMQEEIRHDKTGQFVTLTFSNESIAELVRDIAKENEGVLPEGYELDNEIARIGVRRFLERWRKETGKSVKHWLITELGQGKHWKWQGTENIHLHGIIFTKEKEMIKEKWKYGWVFIGSYVTERTINYMVKYMTKVDPLHKEYNAKILTSAGIGKGYMERLDVRNNKYVPRETRETYETRKGVKLNLPIYYRNKIYTEDEREQLWIEKLDKQIRWVNGEKIDVSTKEGMDEYYKVLKFHQARNKRLGYGDNEKNWDRVEYENQRRKILLKKRLAKVADMEEDDDI